MSGSIKGDFTYSVRAGEIVIGGKVRGEEWQQAESQQQYFWEKILGRCSRSRNYLGTASFRPLSGRWQNHWSKLKVKDSTKNMWSGVGIWVSLSGKEKRPSHSLPIRNKAIFVSIVIVFISHILWLFSSVCIFSPRNMGYTRSYYISNLALIVLLRELMLSVTLDRGYEFTETLPFYL